MRMKPSAEDEFAAFLNQLGQVDDLARPSVVRPELAAIFDHGQPSRAPGVPAADLPVHLRRRRMLTALSSALATLTGKVVLGTAVAAASVGVAHSAGVVDVPGLPDTTPAVESPDVTPPGSSVGSSSTGDDARQDGADTGGLDDPGVDGAEIADRATSGEPQEDGREFGTSVAEDATGGTPAEDRVDGAEPPEVPAEGAETASENMPDTAPDGGDVADEHVPDDAPATDAPTGRP